MRIDELGLAWLDYSARNYDAVLGKWLNIKPYHADLVVPDIHQINNNYEKTTFNNMFIFYSFLLQ